MGIYAWVYRYTCMRVHVCSYTSVEGRINGSTGFRENTGYIDSRQRGQITSSGSVTPEHITRGFIPSFLISP